MLNYYLHNGLFLSSDTETIPPDASTIAVLSVDEYTRIYEHAPHYHLLSRSLSHIHCCKVEIMGSFVSGTFCIPPKDSGENKKIRFGFYMSDTELIFIEEQDYISAVLNRLKEFPISESPSVSYFLFAFMEYLIKDDLFSLQHLETYLNHLEEQLLDRAHSEFQHQILEIRKQLSSLSAYYEQLQDMGEDLQQSPIITLDEKGCYLFGLFSSRCSRLYSDVQMQKEYSMQLQEMHQAQIDLRQNEIMKFLTVVTTIFMPLTLITGWYGMNFSSMPGLSAPYGYAVICLISLIIVLAEWWLFKVKKWFD